MNRMNVILLSALAVMMTACSDDQKMKSFWEQCSSDPTGCMALYRNAATQAGGSSAIVGAAAAAGLPQVAPAGSTPQTGQVPDTSVLPASVSQADVQKRAMQIQQALKQLDQEDSGGATFSPASASGSGGGGSSRVEIGVARLPESSSYTEPEGTRQPASYFDRQEQGIFDSGDSAPSTPPEGSR